MPEPTIDPHQPGINDFRCGHNFHWFDCPHKYCLTRALVEEVQAVTKAQSPMYAKGPERWESLAHYFIQKYKKHNGI